MANRRTRTPNRARSDEPVAAATLPAGAATPGHPSESDAPGSSLADSIATVVREIRERVAELSAREDDLAERWQRLAEEERQLHSGRTSHATTTVPDSPEDSPEAELAGAEPTSAGPDASAAQTPRGLIRRLLDIRRRERESTGDVRQAWQAIEQGRAWVEAQKRFLDEQSAELERRNTELDQRQKALALRLRELAAQENVRAEARGGTARQRAELEALAADLQQQRAALDERAARVQQREQALAEAQRRLTEHEAALGAAEAELTEQREQLEHERDAADEARRLLAEKAADVDERAHDVEVRHAELTAREEELTSRGRELELRCAALDAQQTDAARRWAKIESEQREIESQRAVLAAGEAELAEARAALDAQRRALEVAGEEVVAAQAALADQRTALEDDAARLAQRTQEQQEHDQRLREGVAEVDAVRARLKAAVKALRARRDELDRGTAELAAAREALSAEQAARETARVEAAERTEALARERTELCRGRAALAEKRQRVAGTLRAYRRRAASLDVATAEAAGIIAADLARSEAELAEERGRLHQQRGQLQERAAALEATESTLRAMHDDLVQREQSVSERRVELERREQAGAALQSELQRAQQDAERQTAELESRRRLLEQYQERGEQEQQRLRAREAELASQSDALREDRRRFEKIEAEFDARLAQLEKARTQLDAAEKRAELVAQEAEAARSELDAREYELHQHSLQQRMNQERHDHERQLLAAEAERLAALRGEAEAELARLRAALESGEVGADVLRIAAPRPRGVWWRGLALAAVVGGAVGGFWYVMEQPQYRTRAELRVAGGAAPESAAWHVARLVQPGVLEQALGDAQRAHVLAAAREVGRLSVKPAADRASVELTLVSSVESAGSDQVLLRDALDAYCRSERQHPAGDDARRNRLAELQGLIVESQAACQARRESLRAMPEPAAFERALVEFEALRGALGPLMAELREARLHAAALRSQDRPSGALDPAVLEKALQDDAILIEDRREYASIVKAYQTELAMAMVVVADPARELRRALNALQAALQEQRLLEPPAKVSAILDEVSVTLDQLDQALAEFLDEWKEAREEVERLGDDGAEVVDLVLRQGQAAEAARGICERSAAALARALERVNNLTQEEGGTREVVVSSLLRGDLGRMQERVAELTESARGVDLTFNFRLEAQDRRLRGLRTRIAQRQESLRAQCQAQADQQAQQHLTEEMQAVGEKAAALEHRRDELLERLLGAALAVRSGAETLPDRRRLEAELANAESELARFVLERDALGGEKAGTTADAESAKRLGATIHAPEQFAGIQRQRNAAAAGGGSLPGHPRRVPAHARARRRGATRSGPFARNRQSRLE